MTIYYAEGSTTTVITDEQLHAAINDALQKLGDKHKVQHSIFVTLGEHALIVIVKLRQSCTQSQLSIKAMKKSLKTQSLVYPRLAAHQCRCACYTECVLCLILALTTILSPVRIGAGAASRFYALPQQSRPDHSDRVRTLSRQLSRHHACSGHPRTSDRCAEREDVWLCAS
jgi:uncharacterized protein with GYD domain